MITHLYSYYDSKDPEEQRRNALARTTWGDTYRKGGWSPCPVMDDTLPRMFNEGTRRLPYIKDLVDEAMKMPAPYICLTNSDTAFSPSLHARFNDIVRAGQIAWGNRRDFGRLDTMLTQAQVDAGRYYCGIDIFLLTKAWWIEHYGQLPDVLLGREGWDAVLSYAMNRSGGFCQQNLIYHEKHSSQWEQPNNRYTLPGQLHNIRLASSWFRKRGISAQQCGIREIPPNLQRQLPTTQETPPGGWRVSYCGFRSKSHCFEIVLRSIKESLRQSGTAIPANLAEIIIRQSYGM